MKMLAGMVAMVLSVTVAGAAAPGADLAPKKRDGITYVSGGVGLESRAAMEAMAKDYNVKLVFALESGEYVAGVRVDIRGASGAKLLEAVADGPWLMARLPAGEYTIGATYAGKTQSRKASVKATGRQALHFRWSK